MANTQHKTDIVRARIEPKVRENAEAVLSELGISMSEAIRIFVNQISLRQAFPIELKAPNALTLKAINESATDETFESADDLFNQVNKSDV
ncbi:type II toxin-antitoxin system RelB/DinJ family antitoxin [Providencia manganoxydans]|uniref:type II toxin-antitoxin system RelB/DinJ family antitoxin n=1 Tax=Providencia manganoxydans TaxID=2923283 RepID=UPI00280E7719|nr:type II toxin-antitoxin system RelB/DinJ family antitoxin [Providencia stuartii]ELR5081959.1 type II toxin-antitoxin system RelB/DinJ family antitoxin [Providencia stuartii]